MGYLMGVYGPMLLAGVLCAVFGTLGHGVKVIYDRWFQDDTKRAAAWAAVRFVEQVWSTLHGRDKLEKALETAEMLLGKRGIPFDSEEMMVLIEAALGEFKTAAGG